MPKNKVFKLSDGRFTYKWTDKSGHARRLTSIKGEKIQTFKQRCTEAEESLFASINLTFGELFEKWRENYQKLNCGEADQHSTNYCYEKFVKRKFSHIEISEIERVDINAILADYARKGYSRSVLDKIRNCFTRPFNYAINEMNLRIYNPADKIKLPKMPSRVNESFAEDGQLFISTNDMERFFQAASSSWYYFAFVFMSLTGMRPSEVLGLKWSDISKGMISPKRAITQFGLGSLKSKAAKRTIPLTTSIIDCLWRQYVMCSDYSILVEWVFPQLDGNQPTMNGLRLAFERARAQTAVWKKVGRKHHGEVIVKRVEFSMYDFRHTFATLAASRMAPKQLQHIMGHANIETTLQIYAGLTAEQRAEAGEIMNDMWLQTATSL